MDPQMDWPPAPTDRNSAWGPPATAQDAAEAEILACLDEVTDPELDESVVAMGFIHQVAVRDGVARIAFRLPTFWCSANFAFLMAEDMKAAVEALPWIRRAEIRLVDHFAAERINDGIAAGSPFAEVFAGEAAEDLAAVRRTFRQKAYLGRQEALLRLLAARDGRAATLALRVGDLAPLAGDPEEEIARAAARYLAARRMDGGRAGLSDAAFTTLDGRPLDDADYDTHLREIRRVRRAAEANAQLCRIYLDARYDPEASLEALEDRKRRQHA